MKSEMKLPKPVETYVRATNAGDAPALESSFAHGAVVKDVGREFRGIPAIKEWADHEIRGSDLQRTLFGFLFRLCFLCYLMFN
jgi:hypothetical protein